MNFTTSSSSLIEVVVQDTMKVVTLFGPKTGKFKSVRGGFTLASNSVHGSIK